MPCYYPITAWQQAPGEKLIFESPSWGATQRGGAYAQLEIGCGQCSGCRLKRSREWAIRCVHEAQMHKHSCYITATYNNENLPSDLSLDHDHFANFIKRLRKALGKGGPIDRSSGRLNANLNCRYAAPPRGEDLKIKTYMCGEYGPTHGRPHYHAILFGIDFNDRLFLQKTPAGANIYKSATLADLWGMGYTSVGDVTFESAAYISRYVMKKRTGDGQKLAYEILDLDTGEVHIRKKEYNAMSRRTGIGKTWLEKYHADVYTAGKVIIRGHQNNPPRYYDKQMEEIDQLQLEDIKHARFIEALAQLEHRTPARLAVQEQVQAAKTKSLQRNAPWKE